MNATETADQPAHNGTAPLDMTQYLQKVKTTANFIRCVVEGEPWSGRPRVTRGPHAERLRVAFGTRGGIDKISTHRSAILLMGKSSKISLHELGTGTIFGNWADLRGRALAYCDEYLKHPSNGRGVNLSGLVQFMTLKISLYYLFPPKKRFDA
jgi:hypothetical protein